MGLAFGHDANLVSVTPGPRRCPPPSPRDIVVRCLTDGGDPNSTKGWDLAQGEPVTIGADDPVEEILRTMSQYKVRRLPVIDGHDLVGVVSQADVARNLPEGKVGDLVEAISS